MLNISASKKSGCHVATALLHIQYIQGILFLLCSFARILDNLDEVA
jgi:hypothetical protein